MTRKTKKNTFTIGGDSARVAANVAVSTIVVHRAPKPRAGRSEILTRRPEPGRPAHRTRSPGLS